METLAQLLLRVRGCTLCASHLPQGPRPILQAAPGARILIAGQAPGRMAHAGGVPFDDASGERLRDWLGIGRAEFYDPSRIAILPMGFCYPGSGRAGDLPPRPECAPAWRAALLAQLPDIRLTVLLGQYAQRYHLPDAGDVTSTVAGWQRYWPTQIPLPHPSPRNAPWLARNPWFGAELLPQLRQRVRSVLDGHAG